MKKEFEYNLRNQGSWELAKVRTINYGTETIRTKGPKIWELLPNEIKNSKSLCEFKNKVIKWKPQGCTCRLCRNYIFNLGFLN